MKKLLKILKWTLVSLVLLIVCLVVFIQSSWDKTFEAPYPTIVASKDSTVIARGRHLVYGPAHCGSCHIPMEDISKAENGEIVPLIGGVEFDFPPGKLRPPNLTPDLETGIGKFTDGELARVLRHMVGRDGRCIFPMMPFAELSDDDLTAIVSFLRSQQPVKHEVKKTEYSFLGKAVLTFGLIKPMGTQGNPPKSVIQDSTIEYGKYLANYVANCVGCHTDRDLKTGEFIGVPFAGGFVFEPNEMSKNKTFVSPNLTPDVNTGLITEWSERTFVDRFKRGKVHDGTPMPWGSFSHMNDIELKALFRYLQSLKPTENKIEKYVYEIGEKIVAK